MAPFRIEQMHATRPVKESPLMLSLISLPEPVSLEDQGTDTNSAQQMTTNDPKMKSGVKMQRAFVDQPDKQTIKGL